MSFSQLRFLFPTGAVHVYTALMTGRNVGPSAKPRKIPLSTAGYYIVTTGIAKSKLTWLTRRPDHTAPIKQLNLCPTNVLCCSGRNYLRATIIILSTLAQTPSTGLRQWGVCMGYSLPLSQSVTSNLRYGRRSSVLYSFYWFSFLYACVSSTFFLNLV